MTIENKLGKGKKKKQDSFEDKAVINMLSTYPQFNKKRKF